MDALYKHYLTIYYKVNILYYNQIDLIIAIIHLLKLELGLLNLLKEKMYLL